MFYENFRTQGTNKRNHFCHKVLDEPIGDGNMRRCKNDRDFLHTVSLFAGEMEKHLCGPLDFFATPISHWVSVKEEVVRVLYCSSSMWAHLRYDRGCIDLYSYEMKIATLMVSRWVSGDRTVFAVDEVPSATTRRHMEGVRKLTAPHLIEVPRLPYVDKFDADTESAEDINGRRENERLRRDTVSLAIKDATQMLQKSLRARKPHTITHHYHSAVDKLTNACALDIFLGFTHQWEEVRPEDIYPEVTQAKLALEECPMTELASLWYPSDIFNPAEVLTR